MKFLKKFATRAEYEAYMATNENYPHVGYIADEGKVEFVANRPLVFYDKITGDGVAYIMTDYYPHSHDFIEFKAKWAGVTQVLFGVRDNMKVIFIWSGSTKGYALWNSGSSTQIKANNDAVNTLGAKYDGDSRYKIYCNEQWLSSAGTSSVQSNTGLYIFASTTDDGSLDSRIWSGDLYYLKITDAETGMLKLDLVPASFGGKAGLYDRVSNKFYANANTEGTLTLSD